MTTKTKKLAQSIAAAKAANQKTGLKELKNPQSGYAIAVDMLTNLIGCVIVGFALGIFCQKVLGTPVILTAGLTFLGIVAGLWSVIRTGIRLTKKG